MGPLIDVLPSVVTDHKLQKPFKLSAFWLYFCQLFYIKNVGKIKKPWKRKNVAIIKKRMKHFFYIRGYNDTLWCYRTRPINYGRVGLDALKTPSVAHVTFALSHFTHTSALASAFSTFAVYTWPLSHFRTSAFYMFPAQGHMFKAHASSPAAAGLVLPYSE